MVVMVMLMLNGYMYIQGKGSIEKNLISSHLAERHHSKKWPLRLHGLLQQRKRLAPSIVGHRLHGTDGGIGFARVVPTTHDESRIVIDIFLCFC